MLWPDFPDSCSALVKVGRAGMLECARGWLTPGSREPADRTVRKADAVDAAGWLREVLQGYRQSRILMTFAELGIGDVFAGGPRTGPEVAAAVAADPAATGRFLRAAEALGLVHRTGERYANSELAARTLTSDGSETQLRSIRRELRFIAAGRI
jgi:hypothetical protein